MLGSIKGFLSQKIWPEGNTKKSTFKTLLDISILVLFGLTFFSIPTFSFLALGKYITWCLTILLIISIFLSLFLYYEIKIDFIFISLILFSISTIISAMLNLFKAFSTTPIMLSILSAIIYCYAVSVKKRLNIKAFIFSAFIGSILFLGVFIFKYRIELISLNFNRLGRIFGDENDIALFLGFGLISSLYFGFNFSRKTIIFNIFNLLFSIPFIICGFSTGSKIFVFLLLFCIIFFPFFLCGKKKIWLAILIIVFMFGLFVLMINLPVFSTIKDRLMSFISTLFGKNIGGGKTGELSTIDRLDMFLCGIQMWLRRPLFGWGPWGFATFSGGKGGWSHNNISESLCNFGLIGSFLFHFGFVVSFMSYIKTKEKKRKTLSFLVICFYLISMFSVALSTQKIYSLIIGMLMADLYESNHLISINFSKIRRNK